MSSTSFGTTYRSGKEVRQTFLDFFKGLDHKFVPSAPVAPQDDPTLLFINAGMNQFKPYFLGENKDGLKRAVNSQKCIRVSGKHNDLDEVGRDGTHHTLFEMLGTWSFGDYYKTEAIKWHWQFFTETLGMPKDRIFVSVFKDDDEALEIWKNETDIEHWRIMKFDEKENFWEMGDVGPCGPCSEMHFDLGDLATQKDCYQDKNGGVNGDDGRFVEFNNLVFIQYERTSDGKLHPLKQKHIDTGSGLERVCSIVQGVTSNYDTDLFMPIIEKIAALSGVAYDKGEKGTPHRVIADHLRTLCFAIADGVTPGNEGRGYVIRRVLRRASRFSQQLNLSEPFIYKLVPTLIEIMGDMFEELGQRQDYITQVIQSEEARFMRTLKDGLTRFDKIVAKATKQKKTEIAGEDVFMLSDTYGFPMDLTGVLADERGFTIDRQGFETCMEEQRERARGSQKFDATFASDEGWEIITEGSNTIFTGYEEESCTNIPTEVLRFREVGDEVLLVLNQSPFYAESGGQVGDQGRIIGKDIELKVEDTFRILDWHVHKASLVKGLINKESFHGLHATVDMARRRAIVRNHSATHLLHAALRNVLGDHVQQQGSLVGPDRLRFDFTHPQAVTATEIREIETIANDQVLHNTAITAAESSLETAKAEGAMALFGEKYGEEVRTIRMGGFSFELCGGTHARATGDIGLIKIVTETSIAAGIRRLEAVTGFGALEQLRQQSETLHELSQQLKAKPSELVQKIGELTTKVKTSEKEIRDLRQEQINTSVDNFIRVKVKDVKGTKVIIEHLDEARFPRQTHQMILESLAGKLGNGVALLTWTDAENLSILSAVGKDAQAKVKAGDLVKELAKHADGRGGGRPDKAQAGSKSPEKEELVRKEAEKLLSTLL
jgi:alanyl-tRNA synthetase